MLKTGLSHGVALVPNPPKERYSCPVTGAHFEFKDVCSRLVLLAQKRNEDPKTSGHLKINKDFRASRVRKGMSKRLSQNVVDDHGDSTSNRNPVRDDNSCSSVEPRDAHGQPLVLEPIENDDDKTLRTDRRGQATV